MTTPTPPIAHIRSANGETSIELAGADIALGVSAATIDMAPGGNTVTLHLTHPHAVLDVAAAAVLVPHPEQIAAALEAFDAADFAAIETLALSRASMDTGFAVGVIAATVEHLRQ